MRQRFSMKSPFFSLLTTVLVVVPAAAQGTNPSGGRYPYWGTAPESFRGSRLNVPVPGASANTISNAAHAPATGGGGDSGLGGSYAPPFITSADIALRLPRVSGDSSDTKAHIWLRVPEKAEVWVEGVKTRQSGASRYFYSPPLRPGKEYAYHMRIRWMKDGKPMEETQRILVHAGAAIRRDFSKSSSEKHADSGKQDARK